MVAKRTIGDYVTLQRGITYKGNLVGAPGPALLGLGSIVPGGGFREGDYKTYGGECPQNIMLTPGDLFVSLKGATKDGEMIGSVARVPNSVPLGRLTQDTVKLEFREPKLSDAQFIYWLLRTPEYRSYCAGRARGSAVVALSRDDFLSYPTPEITKFRLQLVAVFESIERKIELNRRMNATLEAMARALFQSWFVDFDPVHAKAASPSGLSDEALAKLGMDASTAALFPAAFQDSELGQIPKGWVVGRLDDALVLQRGFDLPASERTHGNYPVMAASGPNGCHDKFMVKGPGVTTGRSGVLGKVFFIHGDFWPLNTSLWVKEFKRVSPTYAFHLLRGLDFEGFNAGSAVPTLNRNHVHNLPVVIPPQSIVEAFDAQVIPLMQQQHTNENQSRTLATLRDTLLPKLLSGAVQPNL